MKKKSSSKSSKPQKDTVSAQTNPQPAAPPSKSAFKPILIIVAIVSVLTVSVLVFRPKAQRVEQPTQQTKQQALTTVDQNTQNASLGSIERRRFIDSLQSNLIIEECCASSLRDCFERKKCPVAPRLVSFVRWLDSLANVNPNITNERIAEELQKRYAMFADKNVHTIDPKGWPVTGDPNAPITISMYYSGTCPVCKSSYRDLYAAVTVGSLKGKAKIVAKPSSAGFINRAIVAAQDMGRFSDYMLEMARRGGRIDTTAVHEIAATLLLDDSRFTRLIDDPSVVKRAEESTNEAEANGIKFVPTFFINGRRYESIVTLDWVVDAVEHIYETEIGKR